MMDKKIFSIIMPIYNTNKEYLIGMFNCLKNQKSQNFKLFMVDDGSEVEYAHFLDDVFSKYDFVELIHNEHKGVSATRNRAIKMVDTEYVMFVDADDTVPEEFTKKAEEYCDEYNPDIIFGVMEFIPHKDINQTSGKIDVFVDDEVAEVKKSLMQLKCNTLNYTVLGTPCARVYRTELVKKILFRENISYMEDQIFNREMLASAKKVITVPDVWYYYYQNEFSAMHKNIYKDLIKNRKNYWDAMYNLNMKETALLPYIRAQMLNEYYYWLLLEIKNKNAKAGAVVKKMKKVLKFSIFYDAFKNTKVSSGILGLKEKIALFFIKTKMYYMLYLIKKIMNR